MRANVSVVIPTLNRDAPLRHTIGTVLAEFREGDEMIIVDQSDRHDSQTEQYLSGLPANCHILRRTYKSVTRAKNDGTGQARNDFVIFLDDDVEVSKGFIDAHVQAHAGSSVAAVFGPVLSPGGSLKTEEELDPEHVRKVKAGLVPDFSCSFSYDGSWTPGGNLSVRRSVVEAVGGFDTSFYGNAMGEDYEFGWRVGKTGRLVYEPRASLIHFAAPSGGTREQVDFSKYLRTFADNVMYLYIKTRGARPLWSLLKITFVFSVSNQAARLGRNRGVAALVTVWDIICATKRAIGLVWFGGK
jgi:GT2 family glycosyltransferase